MKIDSLLLAKQPFLKGLSQSHLVALSNNALEVEFPADKIIFKEGFDANRFYIILEGEVALESTDGKKEKEKGARCIQLVKAGDVLGWSWLFPPYKWNFNARAVKPTRAIIFLARNLREQCEQDKAFGYELMKRVSKVVIKRLQSTRVKMLKTT